MNNAPSSIAYSRIIFWEPSWSPHKSDFIASIARKLLDVEIVCVADKKLSELRLKMGWSSPTPDGHTLIISPQKNEIDKLFHNSTAKTFHVLSGMRGIPSIVAALERIRKTNSCFALMSEPRVREGWRGELRYIQSWLTESYLRQNSSFILAIGKNGPTWFTSTGYHKEKVFPFAYFVKPSPLITLKKSKTPLRIGYLGRLVKEKGIYELVNACSKLSLPYTLLFAGNGPEHTSLDNHAMQVGVNANFLGVIPMSETSKFLESLDVLVLASTTKDGWGVVVSEALMAGTSVITTNHVGASLILDNNTLGHVIPPNSPESIRLAIEKLEISGAFSEAMRCARTRWARESISANAGADFFIKILQWSSNKKNPPPTSFHHKHKITYSGDTPHRQNKASHKNRQSQQC